MSNIYDNPTFFEQYAKMDRSKGGLAMAGEWECLRSVLPEVKGKKILDLGCGYGWHCLYAIENGANSCIGVDVSSKMLEVAKQKNSSEQIQYIHASMEEVKFEANSFDLVICSLAFHYVEDYFAMIQKIKNWLVDGGHLVFTVEHPVFTAKGDQDWYYDEQGEKLHFPVDHYFYEGKREAVFLNTKMTKYHRTLETYLETLLSQDFVLEHIKEPAPPVSMLELPGMKECMRRPMMLIVSARKG